MTQSNNIVNYIRSGSIGGVSGVKGGALAGAIGGTVIMTINNIGTAGPGFVVYSMIFGATTGMMAGALISYFWGFLAGIISEAVAVTETTRILPFVWYSGFLVIAALLGIVIYPDLRFMGAMAGLLLGLGAGWVALRDFIRMTEYQTKADEDSEEIDRTVAER
ncbi:MAG: hypothetical protein AAF633_04135 [Chloroflexota bacterium]